MTAKNLSLIVLPPIKNDGKICPVIYLFIVAASTDVNDGEQYACRNSRTDNACNVRTHSVHQQVVGRILFLTDLLSNTGSHRNCRYARRADKRIDGLAGYQVHNFAEQHAAGSSKRECDNTQQNNLSESKSDDVVRGFSH